ncbi:MAG: hypothetical protein HUU15_07885 [Candidatus Brocadiae bacterium]|nr:hypothetical protein [Candidatus Brocadiia bacterium]
MEPAAAFELYRRRVFAQPELTDADGGLFAAMRAEDKQANLRLVMGISRWVIERIERIPRHAREAHQADPLTLLTRANGAVARSIREYRGGDIAEFRGIVMAAVEAEFLSLFGHAP